MCIVEAKKKQRTPLQTNLVDILPRTLRDHDSTFFVNRAASTRSPVRDLVVHEAAIRFNEDDSASSELRGWSVTTTYRDKENQIPSRRVRQSMTEKKKTALRESVQSVTSDQVRQAIHYRNSFARSSSVGGQEESKREKERSNANLTFFKRRLESQSKQ